MLVSMENTENYHPTAIGRTKPSAPATWIKENIGFHPGSTLDYGCGRGVDVKHFDIEGYDPNGIFAGYPARGHYETILCTYVLNVIPTEEEREEVIQDVKGLLVKGGVAYFSVRADKSKLNGWTGKDTFQTFVDLDYPIVHRTSGYIIYEVKE